MVQSVTKTRQDNDITNYIGVVYDKNVTELSWLIISSTTYDEN